MIDIRLRTPTGSAPAVLAEPDPARHGRGPDPAVVIVHDITGTGADLRTHLRRVADLGYLALAPDLFADGARPVCIATAMRDLLRHHGPTVDTILAAQTWLRTTDDCTGAVGVIGFCLGGGFALLTAAQGFDAAAPFYGQVPTGQHAALAGACPIVASFGRRDPLLSTAERRLRRSLDEHGVTHDIRSYDGVGHSFANRIDLGAATPLLRITGFAYDEQAAADAWRRVEAFFGQHLRQRSGTGPVEHNTESGPS